MEGEIKFAGIFIEGNNYAKIKNHIVATLCFLPLILFDPRELGWILAATLLFVSFLGIVYNYIINKKQLHNISGTKRLDISLSSLMVVDRKHNVRLEYIELDNVDEIQVKFTNQPYKVDFRNCFDLWLGKDLSNYIIVKKDGKEKRLAFDYESFYMVEQLKKIVTHWQVNYKNVKLIT